MPICDKKHYESLKYAACWVAYLTFVLIILGIHQVLRPGHVAAQVFFVIGWITVSAIFLWVLFLAIRRIIDGNPLNDNLVSFMSLISMLLYYFIFGGMTFMLLWVFNDTKYWTNLPNWHSNNSTFLAFVHLTFTAILSNGVGFGPYLPSHSLTEILYVIISFNLFLVGVLVISTGTSIAFANHAKKYKEAKTGKGRPSQL